MHLLTPKGISAKLALTMHILKCKEKKYELLDEEIARLHDALAASPFATNPDAPELLQEHEPHL